MQVTLENLNQQILGCNGFSQVSTSSAQGPFWREWELSPQIGTGKFWVYEEKDLFDIKIHDFSFREDSSVEFNLPGYLSITYYESVSGEQLTPYRRLNAGCIQSFVGRETPYRILMHKGIPIRSIGVGISPAYYEEYLKKQYPKEYSNPYSAFVKLDQDESFPELVLILKQIKAYRGDGIAAKLFYEGKVAEVISVLVEHTKGQSSVMQKRIAQKDVVQMQLAVAYLHDHYSSDIPLSRLAQIACMGITKFKTIFKQLYGCSVTKYTQQRRLSHAECLLSDTDLTIGQIAECVGYSTPGHLARAFRESTGLTPNEYRKMAHKK